MFKCVHASLPSWECGLKYNKGNRANKYRNVTPFVGVWIEIDEVREKILSKKSLPSWKYKF